MYQAVRVRPGRIVLSLLLAACILTGSALIWRRHVSAGAPAAAVNPPEGVRLPIIMYHSVLSSKAAQGRYVISPEAVENDLKYLKEQGYETVVVADLIRYVEEGAPLPAKPIMLTFDDGFYNNYLYVLPLMERYDCRMVISPIGVETARFSDSGEENASYSYITWARLKEMGDSGRVEIQNHSYNMHTTRGGRNGTKKKSVETLSEYQTVFSQDVLRMQALLEEHTGVKPTAFTYPFGAVSKESVPILKELGFRAAFTCEERVNTLTRDPEQLYRLGRFNRPAKVSTEAFFARLA